MKWRGIHIRMLVAALVPATLVAVMMAGAFMTITMFDLDKLHDQQARSLTRQVAIASEYGLYSGDLAQLESVTAGAARMPDVIYVAVLDSQLNELVAVGKSLSRLPPNLGVKESEFFDRKTDTDLLHQPIVASNVKLDDLFEPGVANDSATQQVLGHVLVEFSHADMHQRKREMLLLSLAVTVGGLIAGYILAMCLGRGVIRPILRLSGMIERIGAGELSVRGELLPNDPLRRVQRSLNQMAERLESNRDDLERQIALATLELRKKKDEAEDATLAKSRFLAAASHDLRQPTHALGMFVARLAQLPHDAQTSELVGNLEASVLAMQDLLNGLLDVSRLDAQAVQVQAQAIALEELFDQLRSGLGLLAMDKGLLLKIRPTTVWVMSDPTLLYRILLNLVSNALRYTHKGGVLVACRVRADAAIARIEVWDSGMGIAPEHHESIFKEFFQVENPERDRRKGLGLGLNIVHRTAVLLGHRLQFKSRLGYGTRFSIDIALAPEGANGSQNDLTAPGQNEELSGLRILVVEDDALSREALVTLLESWAATVDRVQSLPAALALLKTGSVPDVIVSDYRLPDGVNGMAAIAQIRIEAGSEIPACLISGDTDPSLMRAARDAGLTLLHKPVRPAKLRSFLRRLVGSRQVEETEVE